MNGSNTVRVIAGVLLALVVGAVAIGAYQMGVDAGAAQHAAGVTGTVVPAAPYYYGWHPFGLGFGFFGFIGTLLFFILIFALIRAIVFGGRRWGGRGWGGPGYGGHSHGGWRGGPWESRTRDTFEDWHREAHGEAPGTGSRPDNPNQA